MKQKDVKTAINRFKKLRKQFSGFKNLILDDWRGTRLIFDTIDVQKCNNQCRQCSLYLLLQKNKMLDELYPANKEDKKIFGPQNFLNCKTLNQYANCYINFLDKKCQTEREIENELKLMANSKIIYSKNGWTDKKFKTKIINGALKICGENKRKIILNYLSKNCQF